MDVDIILYTLIMVVNALLSSFNIDEKTSIS